MLKAKTKAYENSEDVKHLMEEALNAMRSYSGSAPPLDLPRARSSDSLALGLIWRVGKT